MGSSFNQPPTFAIDPCYYHPCCSVTFGDVPDPPRPPPPAPIPNVTYATIDSSYNLTFVYSTGQVDTVGNVRGPPGPTGDRGAEFDSAYIDDCSNLHFVRTDGTIKTVPAFYDNGASVLAHGAAPTAVAAGTSARLDLPATLTSRMPSASVHVVCGGTCTMILARAGVYAVTADVAVTGPGAAECTLELLSNATSARQYPAGVSRFSTLVEVTTAPATLCLVLTNTSLTEAASVASVYMSAARV